MRPLATFYQRKTSARLVARWLCATAIAGAAGAAGATDRQVTDGGDSGAPSQYRTQVAAANQQGGSNRVVVAVPTVTLGSASIDVTSNLTVTPNSGSVEISGSATHFLDNAGL